jgi:hypothetical protein
MARATPLLNRFNGGELSPLVEGRTDLDWYYSGARIMENLIGLAQGPATRRPGTRFVVELASSSSRAALIPFEFNTEQAYILEAGNGYLRFLKDEGAIFVADVATVISNGDFASGITGWTDKSAGGATISYDATNHRLNLNANGTNGGHAEQAVTIAAPDQGKEHVLYFQIFGAPGDIVCFRIGTSSVATDIVNDIQLEPGYHCIPFTPNVGTVYVGFFSYLTLNKTLQIDNIAFVENTVLRIGSPFTEAQLARLKWAQSQDVLYLTHPEVAPYKLSRRGHTSWSLTPIAFQDGPYIEENITATTLSPSAVSGKGVTITASAAAGINDNRGFLPTDVGRLIRIGHVATSWVASTAYNVGDIRYNKGNVYSCTRAGTSAASGGPEGTGRNIVDSGALWEFANLGGLRWGWARIVAWTSATVVTADVGAAFGAASAIASWRLGIWSGTTGYPADCSFHEERLVFVGAQIVRPTRFDTTASADFENFKPGTEDADAIAYNIGANQANPLRWVMSAENLIMGTASGEVRVRGSNETDQLTPTTTQAKFATGYGVADIKPLRVSNAILFVQRQGLKLRELAYALENDGFRAPDLTKRAEHITAGGLLQIVYQQEPWSIVWGRTGNGALIGMSYERDESVLGWHRHPLGGNGYCESLAVIPAPSAGSDQLWMIVRRTINGQTKRYIEFLEDALGTLENQADAFYVDCGASYYGLPATVISGLDWLEGCTVKILADGAARPDAVVTAGAITLDREASIVHVGLGSTWKLKPMLLEAGSQEGTAQGKTKIVDRVWLRMFRTLGVKIGRDEANLETLNFRSTSDAMDTPVPLFTGTVQIPFKGTFKPEGDILIVGDGAFPATILALVPRVTTNEG